jgi:ketosteroid isomerase-like protein
MSSDANVVLATRYFDAVARGDAAEVEALLAPDAVLWVNVAGEMRAPEIVALVGTLAEQIPDFRYEEAQRTATATGFVEEHLARGTAPDGRAFSYPACCVATVSDGRITRINEYLDSADLASLGVQAGAAEAGQPQ